MIWCFFFYKGCGEESECFPYLFWGEHVVYGFVSFFRMPVINKQLYFPKADKSYQNANGALKNAVLDGHTLHSPLEPVCSGWIGSTFAIKLRNICLLSQRSWQCLMALVLLWQVYFRQSCSRLSFFLSCPRCVSS